MWNKTHHHDHTLNNKVRKLVNWSSHGCYWCTTYRALRRRPGPDSHHWSWKTWRGNMSLVRRQVFANSRTDSDKNFGTLEGAFRIFLDQQWPIKHKLQGVSEETSRWRSRCERTPRTSICLLISNKQQKSDTIENGTVLVVYCPFTEILEQAAEVPGLDQKAGSTIRTSG